MHNERLGETSQTAKDWLIVFTCVFLNVLLIAFLYPRFAYIGTDGVSYALLAESLAKGEGMMVFGHVHTFFSPLFSITIAPFFLLLRDSDVAAHVTMIVTGVFSIVLFYFALLHPFGRRVAAVSTLFFAVNATVVWRNLKPVSQPLATLLSIVLLSALMSYVRRDKHNVRDVLAHSFLLGVISGGLYLTRPEYVVLFIPLAIFLYFINRSYFSFSKNLQIIGTALLGIILVALPYIIFLHEATGQWSFTGRLSEQALVAENISRVGSSLLAPGATDGNPIIAFVKSMITPHFLKFYFSNLYDLEWILLKVFGVLGFSFFGIGLYKIITMRRTALLGALLVPTSIIFALTLGHTGENGYVEPFLPAFIVLIGVGCVHFIDMFIKEYSLGVLKRKILWMGIVGLSAFYFSFLLFQNYFFLPPDYKPIEYQQFGEWYKKDVGAQSETPITARKPEIAYYSGTDWVEFTGDETVEQLISIMKEGRSRYLVLDTRSLTVNEKRLREEIREKGEKSPLEFVRTFGYGEEHLTLYRLK